MENNNFTPTNEMVIVASEGLKQAKDTEVSQELIRLADKTVRGEELEYPEVVKIKEWHDTNQNIATGEPSYLLSMGVAGKQWIEGIMEQIGNVKQSLSMGVDSKAELILLSSNQVRVPLAKKGKWYHDSYGVVEFKDEDFTNIVNNHKANRLGFSPYITYGHVDEEPNSTDSQRKRGDLVDFKLMDDVLYGDFSVKEDTYDLVKDGEYEFSSGEFIRNFTDKDSGEKVGTAFMRVALTNAPFIPFKEKVQALSVSDKEASEDCIQTILPFVLGLSISNEIIEPAATQETKQTNTEDIMQVEATVENKEEVVTQVPEKPEEGPKEVVETLSQETLPEVVVEQKLETITQEQPKMEVEKTETTQAVAPSVDLNALVTQVNSLKNLYETKLDEANTTIGNLTNQMGQMAAQLTAHEVVTQAYSQNMSKAQEQALYRKLSDEGVMPVVIQRFSMLKSSLESAQLNNTVVKLSTSVEGETKDANLIEAVAELLIDAVKTEPVEYQQFGVAVRKSQTEAFSEGFGDIIARNKELATKRTVG